MPYVEPDTTDIMPFRALEETLANGLRVIVANKPGLPLVSASLRISAGGALDPRDKAGLATMTADLTTRGTESRSATEIARQIENSELRECGG